MCVFVKGGGGGGEGGGELWGLQRMNTLILENAFIFHV